MRSRLQAILVFGLVLGAGDGLAGQVPPGHELSASQAASLMEHLAVFNTENAAGPLDSCSVLRATGFEPTQLVELNQRLGQHLDVLGDPCTTPRHHGTLYNRARVGALETHDGGVTVRLTTQVSDLVSTWDLQFVEREGVWTRVSATEKGSFYIHGGENRAPRSNFENTIAVLSIDPDKVLRVDPRFAGLRDTVLVWDFSGFQGSAVFEEVDEIRLGGRFLERVSCVNPDLLGGRPELRFPPPEFPIDCAMENGEGIDVLLGGLAAIPPNRWRRLVWGISSEWVRVFEIRLSWTGRLESTQLVAEIPIA